MTQSTPSSPARRQGWRTIDFMVTVTIGVVFGVAFLGLGYLYYPLTPLGAAFPPGLGILGGLWFVPAVLAGAIVRKPGAALLAELLAAFVEMLLGGQWGYTTMISGFAQGIGVELGFLAFGYRRFGIAAIALAGAGGSAVEWVYEAFATSSVEWSAAWKLAYLVIMVISGAVLNVLICLPLSRLLARAGVLGAFDAGREHAQRSRV